MDTRRILADLRSERDRIDRAIAAIESLGNTGVQTAPRGRPAGAAQAPRSRRRRGPMSAASRKRLSELMKQRWAERKKKAAKA